MNYTMRGTTTNENLWEEKKNDNEYEYEQRNEQHKEGGEKKIQKIPLPLSKINKR